jgi:AraC-like DNA-binding protein
MLPTTFYLPWPIVTLVALLLAGYSIFCALALAIGHVGRKRYPLLQKVAGLVLLAALAWLQGCHVAWLQADLSWPTLPGYRLALFTVAPAFYLFSRPLLDPATPQAASPTWLWHLLPLTVALLLPAAAAQALAFVIGAGYLLWLAYRLFPLRTERENFRLEISLLGSAFVIACAVALLGLQPGRLPGTLFHALYASAIGGALLLVQLALLLRPQLEEEVRDSVQAAYSHSTLQQVDCEAMLMQMETLMQTQRRYLNPELNLASLAAELSLSGHQLSELLNSRLGKGFSRYLREVRVAAAQQMLCDEPSASVLSVGLSVGFTSQSNFYEAFREVAGTTPGQYRKLHCRAA